MTTVELVLQYLRNLREQGVDCLPVDEEARAILREWMLAARRGIQKPVAASPFPSPPIPTAEGISALRSALQETST
ncbi:MAG: hypothetical protein IKW19_00310, partial [Akkermansia sp.]|nr:hypothetical protein [Akkermansia sp.]